MKHQWLEMRYNRDVGFWVMNDHGQDSLLYENEWFNLYITEEKSCPCRLEFHKQWVLIMGSLRLQLRKQDRYKVEV